MFFKSICKTRSMNSLKFKLSTNVNINKRFINYSSDFKEKKFNYSLLDTNRLMDNSKFKMIEQRIPLKFNQNKFIKKFDLKMEAHATETFDHFLNRAIDMISSMMKENADCMVLAYSQTKKKIDPYTNVIISGHMIVFEIDQEGNIAENELISARPDLLRKDEGYDVQAIDNPRLRDFSRSMRVFPVKFSSFYDEIKSWAYQAFRDSEYPFIFLTVPFDSHSVTKESYKKKSYKIRERSKQGFYALLTYYDPITGKIKENLNCITYTRMFFEELFSRDFSEQLGVDPTTQFAGSVFMSAICETLGQSKLIEDKTLFWPEEKLGPLKL